MLLAHVHHSKSPFRQLIFNTLIFSCIALLIYHGTLVSIDNWNRKSHTHHETSGIPEKIWYKLGPYGLNNECQEHINTCLRQNPSYKFEFMTDESSDTWVQDNFAHRPEIIETYLSLSIPILKADILRYLLLFVEGGIWSDLDVSCAGIPIQEWISDRYKQKASLVVGWEFDVGWGDNFVREFATWTMLAKPGSRHMLMVIEDILEGVRTKVDEHNVTIGGLKLDMIGDVVDFTGPRRMTRSVIKSLESSLGEKVEVKDISSLEEPMLIGDVLILPGISFAASSNRYEKEQVHLSPALVTHHFAGSWKNEYGGEEG